MTYFSYGLLVAARPGSLLSSSALCFYRTDAISNCRARNPLWSSRWGLATAAGLAMRNAFSVGMRIRILRVGQAVGSCLARERAVGKGRGNTG
jgi:hypothetical protein